MRRPAVYLASLAILISLTAPAGAAERPVRNILGGQPTLAGQYPAQGYLEIDGDGDGTFASAGDARCAGTLVAPRHLLTAAHCVVDRQAAPLPPARFRVYMGDPDVRPPNSPSGFFSVVANEVNDAYPSGPYGLGSDVAVLTLSRPAPYEPTRLLELDESRWWRPLALARIIGWGRTAPGGATSPLLLEADVAVISDADCAALFASQSPGLPNPFDERTMLCAGDPARSTCEGDSGGPLLVFDGAGRLALAGVTSWGDACQEPTVPEVYARVGSDPLNSWIRARLPRAGFTSSPATPRAGETVTFTSTSTGPAPFTTLRWDLDGDGQVDDAAGPSASRSFLQGDHSVALEAANALGDRATARRTITVAAALPKDVLAPKVSSASLSPRVFAVSRAGTAERPVSAAKRGTRLRYRLSERARVVVTIERARLGRRVGKRCLAATRRARRRPRCTRYLRFGRFAMSGRPGANSKRYSGRIGRRSMRPGSYRATLMATDAVGNRSRATRLKLAIVRR